MLQCRTRNQLAFVAPCSFRSSTLTCTNSSPFVATRKRLHECSPLISIFPSRIVYIVRLSRNSDSDADVEANLDTDDTENSAHDSVLETTSDTSDNKQQHEDQAAPSSNSSSLKTVWAALKRFFQPPAFIVGLITGVTLSIVLIFVPGPGGTRDALLRQKVTLFNVILHDINDSYVEKVDINRLFETGVNSMLGTLDPYTQFENNAQALEMSVKTNGRYAGVGLGLSLGDPSVDLPDSPTSSAPPSPSPSLPSTTIPPPPPNGLPSSDSSQSSTSSSSISGQPSKSKSTLTSPVKPIIVVSAFEGYAFDAGVRPGDIIQSIEGKSVVGASLENVTEMLRGAPGTEVNVTVNRQGFSSPLSFTLSRRDVRIKDVPAYSFVGDANDGIAYIRLQSFAKDAASEVTEALESLSSTRQPIRSVILDLRGNPGGLLNAAIEVAELFVPRDSTIVSTRGRGLGPSPTYVSSRDPIISPGTQVAVLVNGQTASASEIVAGAIQDLDLGIVVGTRTFGKGLVQNVQELPFSTALKYTVGKYYTPSGRCIQALNYAQAQGNGQFESKQVEESQRKEFQTSGGRIVRDGGGIEPDVDVQKRPSFLELALLRQNMYFRFANRFGGETKLQSLPDDFQVSDTMYKDFVKFVGSAEFKYESRFDEAFDELDEMLKDVGYDTARAKINELKRTTTSEMRSDFLRHERDIRAQLESAIRFRFQPDSKRIIADLRNDYQLSEAILILQHAEEYNGLLNGSQNVDDMQHESGVVIGQTNKTDQNKVS